MFLIIADQASETVAPKVWRMSSIIPRLLSTRQQVTLIRCHSSASISSPIVPSRTKGGRFPATFLEGAARP